MNLKEVFEKYEKEYLKFDRIETPLNKRPDVCAFLLIDSIVVPKPNRSGELNDMVAAAEHDEIYLNVDIKELSAIATEEQIRDLIRCGIRFVEDVNSLAMFV